MDAEFRRNIARTFRRLDARLTVELGLEQPTWRQRMEYVINWRRVNKLRDRIATLRTKYPSVYEEVFGPAPNLYDVN